MLVSLCVCGVCSPVLREALVFVASLHAPGLSVCDGTTRLGAGHHKHVSVEVPIRSFCFAWFAFRG